MTKSVVFTFGSSDDSGAGRMGFYFAREFRRRGWRVSALCPEPVPGEANVIDRFREAAVAVEVVPVFYGRFDPWLVARFVAHLRSREADLVVGMHQREMKFAGLAALWAKVPYVVSGQNTFTFLGGWLRQRLYQGVHRWILNRSCVEVVATSDRVAAEFRQRLRYRGPVSIQPNGVDTAVYREANAERSAARSELGYGADDRVFVSVGRITEQKNQLGLVEAFAAAFPAAGYERLLLVGGVTQDAGLAPVDREYLQCIEARIRELGLAERVLLTGWRLDVPRLLAAGDVYVQNSLWEGSSLAVIEAMAAGLPVVMADSGGVLPEFRNGTHGWVVAVDHKAELLGALRSAGGLPVAELQSLGSNAQQLACGHYDATTVAGRFFDLANRVARESARAGASGAGRPAQPGSTEDGQQRTEDGGQTTDDSEGSNGKASQTARMTRQ